MTIYWIQTQCILLLGEQVLTIFLCTKRVRLNWNFIVHQLHSVPNATYSSHGAPCPAQDLFPWLNTRVKVHISVWTIREYPKRHSSYLSDSGDIFLPLQMFTDIQNFYNHFHSMSFCNQCGVCILQTTTSLSFTIDQSRHRHKSMCS